MLQRKADHPSGLLNVINDRLFLIERSFIVEHGLSSNSPMQRHVLFSPSESRDVFPNSAFAFILDLSVRWTRSKEEECLEEIRVAFTKVQWCIESANHLMQIDHLIFVEQRV